MKRTEMFIVTLFTLLVSFNGNAQQKEKIIDGKTLYKELTKILGEEKLFGKMIDGNKCSIAIKNIDSDEAYETTIQFNGGDTNLRNLELLFSRRIYSDARVYKYARRNYVEYLAYNSGSWSDSLKISISSDEPMVVSIETQTSGRPFKDVTTCIISQ